MKVAPFRYSGESILFAPITGLRFQALHLSFKLYQSNKSTFYKVLLCVTLFRIIDNALGYIQFVDLPRLGLPLTLLQSVIQILVGNALLALNAIRLHTVCAKNWPRAVKALLALAFTSALIVTAAQLVLVSDKITGSDPTPAYVVFALWTMYDVIVSALMCILFVLELQATTYGRADVKAVLAKTKFILATEVFTMFLCNLIEMLAHGVDPFLALYNAADAMHIYLFVKFLSTLQILLRRRKGVAAGWNRLRRNMVDPGNQNQIE